MNALAVIIIFVIARIALSIRLYIKRRNRKNVKTMVVLGSGGHTAEMLRLLRSFDLTTYSPRCYIVASTDKMSSQKARGFEAEFAARPVEEDARRGDRVVVDDDDTGASKMRSPQSALMNTRKSTISSHQVPYAIAVIPRSREVGQSFTSSVWTTLRALWHAVFPVFSFLPDLLLINGPGTSVPVVMGAIIVRMLGLGTCRIVYIESIARVHRLSLTGKILYHLRLTDEFLVQWENLKASHPRAVFAGRLM